MKKRCLSIASVILFFSCSFNAGSNNVTVTKAIATVYKPDGKTPAVGATVKIFKTDVVNGQYDSKQITDANGHYSITGLSAGTYNILAQKDSLVTFQDSAFISENETTLRSDTLECPSTVTGFIGIQPNHDPRTVTIQVVGMDKYFNNVDDSGKFVMKGMASGKYSLLTKSTLQDYTPTTQEISVNPCSNDSLKDTLKLIYTGIPVVTRLAIAYDTLNGVVRLSWPKSAYRDLLSYAIFKDYYDSVNLSISPIANRTDTIFYDTIFKNRLAAGAFSFTDTNKYHFTYRVALRNSAGDIGKTFRYIDIVAASPIKVQTTFEFSKTQIAKGFKTDTASINDSLLYRVEVANPTRRLKTLSWLTGAGEMIRTKNLDSSAMAGSDSMFYIWNSLGQKRLICKVVDQANTEWVKYVDILIVEDKPIVKLESPRSSYWMGEDTMHLHLNAIDKYGSIDQIKWDVGNTGSFVNNYLIDTSIIVPKKPIAKYVVIVQATDDDANSSLDTIDFSIGMFVGVTKAAGYTLIALMVCTVFDNKMWALGGSEESNSTRYSLDGVNWIKPASSGSFTPRYGHDVVVYGNITPAIKHG